jgi:hypothetical protein
VSAQPGAAAIMIPVRPEPLSALDSSSTPVYRAHTMRGEEAGQRSTSWPRAHNQQIRLDNVVVVHPGWLSVCAVPMRWEKLDAIIHLRFKLGNTGV